MKKDPRQRIAVQFASDVHFEATPTAPAESRQVSRLFAKLQDQLVRRCLGGTRGSSVRRHLNRVANEAAAMAWTTPYPLLVMPALFEEKTRLAGVRAFRQQQIQTRSQRLMESTL